MTNAKEMSASEAIYGFVAWLTTRMDQITMSQHNNAAPAADLVKRFCEYNKLEAPRDGWDDLLEMPDLVD